MTINYPRILHLTCKDKNNINNPHYQMCYNKYKEIYDDFEIIIYGNKEIYELIDKFYPEHSKMIRNIKNSGLLSDTFRYFILFLKGGIYSDMDCMPICKIDNIFTEKYIHGDIDRNNCFWIYPKNKELINIKWDHHENPCNNCRLIKNNELYYSNNEIAYKCFGHYFFDFNKHKIIVGKEFHMGSYNHNRDQICQWYIIALEPNLQIFKKLFDECIKNIKNIDAHSINSNNLHMIVEDSTGPRMFTRILNESDTSNILILPGDYFCVRYAGKINTIPQTIYSKILHGFTGIWKHNYNNM